MNDAASGYLTAANLAADDTLRTNARVKIPVWLSRDGNEGNAKLLLGGYKIDHENACIYLKPMLDVKSTTGDQGKEQLALFTMEDGVQTRLTGMALWMTVATVLETPLVYQTEVGSHYLPRTFHQVINLPNVVPELRENAWLPDLAGGNHAISKLATSAQETYVDVAEELQAAVANASAATPSIASPIRVRFPFLPVCNIGDRLAISGRDVGATGDEVITHINYSLHGAYETAIEATNVTAQIQPDEFVGGGGAANTLKIVEALRAQRKDIRALQERTPAARPTESADVPDRTSKSAKMPRQLVDDGNGNLVEQYDWTRAH
jgi:hypothetical protein